MTVEELLKYLRARGVHVSRGPKGLRVTGPRDVLTEKIRGVLVELKSAVLARLDNESLVPATRRENEKSTGEQANPFDPLRVARVNSVIWESGERLSAAFPDGAQGFHERLRVANPPAWSEVDRAWSRVGAEASKFLRDAPVDETALLESTLAHERVCLDAFAIFAESSKPAGRGESASPQNDDSNDLACSLAREPHGRLPLWAQTPVCRNCQTTEATVFLIMDDDSRLCGACWRM
ncbi:MAG: hypothetical protein HYY84_12940 [Deltaproteobacteria bacterium]|nr:hypothetical protein [Deltaproteobacteria bacterium]